MSNQKTVIQALEEASKRRSEIYTIIDQTNWLSDLSGSYHDFGYNLYVVREKTSTTDEDLIILLSAVQNDDAFVYDGSDKYIKDMLNSARCLIREAERCGVVVDFVDLINKNHEDVDYISTWSSSSLSC